MPPQQCMRSPNDGSSASTQPTVFSTSRQLRKHQAGSRACLCRLVEGLFLTRNESLFVERRSRGEWWGIDAFQEAIGSRVDRQLVRGNAGASERSDQIRNCTLTPNFSNFHFSQAKPYRRSPLTIRSASGLIGMSSKIMFTSCSVNWGSSRFSGQ